MKCQSRISDPQMDNLMLNEPLSYKEVKNAINSLKLKKACGVDNIPNEILKNPYIYFYIICFIIVLLNCSIPSEWFRAIIYPIPKDREKCMIH